MGCWKNFNEYCDGNLIKNAIESIGTEKGEINVDYVNHGERPIVWSVGQSALHFRCIADDTGSYDPGLLSPGFGPYDGDVLNPGGLTAETDGHMVLDAEGSSIFFHSDDATFTI